MQCTNTNHGPIMQISTKAKGKIQTVDLQRVHCVTADVNAHRSDRTITLSLILTQPHFIDCMINSQHFTIGNQQSDIDKAKMIASFSLKNNVHVNQFAGLLRIKLQLQQLQKGISPLAQR